MEKRSIAVVIRESGKGHAGRVLGVRRPADDEDLPNAWGLPAGSLREGESWEDAVRRAGREKLGVELAPGAMLREGTVERAGYTLRMRLFESNVTAGTPSVPGRASDVTQYTEWKWSDADVFRPAAEKGSLCCRLYLEEVGR